MLSTLPGATSVNRLLIVARRQHPDVKRFIKFLFVGSIGFVVDFATFNLLTHLLYVADVAAQAISFAVAVVSNFLWNYLWIYPESRTGSVTRKLGQFGIVSVIGLIIRTPIFAYLLPIADNAFASLGMAPDLRSRLDGNAALAGAVVVVLVWNFLANRLWTYGDVDRRK